MKLKVGFTYDSKSEYLKLDPDSGDKYAEFDTDDTLSDIETALKTSGNEIIKIGNVKNLIKRINNGERWDIVFNICEGLKGRNRESQVPVILELYDIPYVGSDGLTLGITLDKVIAKKIVGYHGIKTAKFVDIKSIQELENNINKIKSLLPVILKPSCEGTSKGVSEKSLCYNIDEVKKYVLELLNKYSQPILVEQFIKGYEFTVAIIGNTPPEVLPPVQILINGKEDLGDDFYTYQRIGSKQIKYVCSDNIDSVLKNKIIKLSLDSYIILGCRDFGRIDLRVDYNLEPYFLECNPLPNLGRDEIFAVAAKKANISYKNIICNILEAGLKRYNIIK